MLKKKLGVEGIEKDWLSDDEKLTNYFKINYFKIPPTLTIPEGCERIGNFAFWRCERLEKVIIPRSVERIRFHAFWGCKNATIILKKRREDFVRIGVRAFYCVKDVKEEIRS